MSAAVRPSAVPVIVTTVPPVIGPEVGVIDVIKGPLGITGPPVYANPRAGTVVVNTPPDGDATVTGDWATGLDTGAVVHVTSVVETAAKVEQGTLAEMLTPATSPRSDPWSVTIVPPAMGPDTGSIEDTTGAVNVNVGPEPEPVETVVTTAGPTVLVPMGATPATQSTCDALRQVNGAQTTPASVTVETSEADAPSPEPAITIVLPSIRPCVTGDTDVTLGAAA
jgi:hypothetical protein